MKQIDIFSNFKFIDNFFPTECSSGIEVPEITKKEESMLTPKNHTRFSY